MRIADPVTHFLSRTEPEPNSGCLLWTGALSRDGYAKAALEGRYFYVHRYLWEMAHGPVPSSLELDHLCRVRHCVRVAHLEPVTGRMNRLRGIGFAAVNAGKTVCVRGHELAGENVYPYRGERRCRACYRERLASAKRRSAT